MYIVCTWFGSLNHWFIFLPRAGSDLILWMMRHLDVEDATEAQHIASMISAFGYILPVEEHVLAVKNDHTFYRFQTPCLWPSKSSEPENSDYAVYLCKRTMQNKQRLELSDYEAENLARLQRLFSHKWEFIYLQVSWLTLFNSYFEFIPNGTCECDVMREWMCTWAST